MFKLLKRPGENVVTSFCFQNNHSKMTAGDVLPLSVVEGECDLITFLEPDYPVPCHKQMHHGSAPERRLWQ